MKKIWLLAILLIAFSFRASARGITTPANPEWWLSLLCIIFAICVAVYLIWRMSFFGKIKKTTDDNIESAVDEEIDQIIPAPDYLAGLSEERISKIAAPLIDMIATGREIKVFNNEDLINPGLEMIDEINRLSLEGRDYLNCWLYYHEDKERDMLLNP